MGKIPDISYWQGFVAFSEDTKAETDYIIHRASCGTAKDQRFAENVAKICALNMPYGVYHYLMALSVDRAKYEAEVFYNSVVKSKPAYLPTVWFADVEDPPLVWKDGKALPMNPNIKPICKAFHDRLRELVGPGAKIGIYSGESIYEPYGKLSSIGWDVLWFANYSKTPATPHHLHQYTSKGTWNNRTRIDLSKLGTLGSLGFLTTPGRTEETAPVVQKDDPPAPTSTEKIDVPAEIVAKCTSGKSWNLRKGDGAHYGRDSYMQFGESLPFVAISASGWVCVRKHNSLVWVTGKAVTIVSGATGAPVEGIAQPAKKHLVRITEPYSWNVRAGDCANYDKLLVAYQGYEWEHVATSITGWYCVRLADGTLGWITPKAAKVV